MSEKKFVNAVRLDYDKCMGCTNCIKRCPTGAIRVRNGKARITVSAGEEDQSIIIEVDSICPGISAILNGSEADMISVKLLEKFTKRLPDRENTARFAVRF